MSRCSTRGRPWHVTRSKARRRRPGAQRPPRRRRTRSAEAGGVHGGRRLPPHLLAELLGVRCVSKGGFLGGSCLLKQPKKKWVASPGPGAIFTFYGVRTFIVVVWRAGDWAICAAADEQGVCAVLLCAELNCRQATSSVPCTFSALRPRPPCLSAQLSPA